MKTLYGQQGQPVGSIDGNGVFLKDGQQVAHVIDGYLYSVVDGEWIGSLASGVIFNSYGAPQAFTADCAEIQIPPMSPTLKSALPPRVLALGEDVAALPARRPPEFLREMLTSTGPTRGRDGYFL